MNKSYALNTWQDKAKRAKLNQKSNRKAILIFLGQFSIYIVCLIGAIADYSIAANFIFSVYIGLVLGQLFLIGHDSCHQAFAKSPLLNKILGRFTFLLTLHSYTLWALEHNVKHHGYTNIKDKDPVWTPMTKKEFDRQRKARQWLERFYRSGFGSGVYYINEIWLKILILPINPDARSEWRKHLPDSFLVVAAFIIQPCIILYLGSLIAPSKPALEVLLLGWIIPFLSWNWIMGFLIYLHHTHPSIPWFRKDEKFPFNQIQTHVTTHVIFPEPFNKLFYNIMEHTAHHIQPSIPMYNLYAAQKHLEEIHIENIVIWHLTFTKYLQITRACKLYDYEQKCWTDFDGNSTSESITNLFVAT
ncbi:MAG: fatty acid desaturase [Rivularia sp. (in: cyanobacteria)]